MTEINVGTVEKPILVPEIAVDPTNPNHDQWWNALASGTASLNEEQLSALLAHIQKQPLR